MVATLTTLISRVRSVVRDTSGDFVTDTDVTQWINEAITDIAARQGIVESEFSGTTADNSIALPPSGSTETLIVDSLILGDDGDEVVFVDDEIWQAYADAGASPTFTLGKIFAEVIYIYPTPTASIAFVLRATHVPVPLSAGSDTHALPLHMERKITDYAKAMAFYKLDDISRGDRHMAMYEEGLFPIASGREISRPGPNTLVPVEGPFDMDYESRHF
jgi:hypothetical protein